MMESVKVTAYLKADMKLEGSMHLCCVFIINSSSVLERPKKNNLVGDEGPKIKILGILKFILDTYLTGYCIYVRQLFHLKPT